MRLGDLADVAFEGTSLIRQPAAPDSAAANTAPGNRNIMAFGIGGANRSATASSAIDSGNSCTSAERPAGFY